MRVLLINPPSPEQLGSPLLGLEYVAASLLARGCEVRVIDAAARHFAHDSEWILREAENFAPRLIGLSLFTRWVWHAYELVERLRGGPWLLVSGGAHATVRPEETLRRGFQLALTGEAEQSLVRVVDWLEGRDDLGRIPGSVFRRPDGSIGYGPPSGFIEHLDDLAPPYLAQPLFDPRWYDPSGLETAPGGILTSRGCPARCTFCANYVTGRSFRYRSAAGVTAEINAWHERCGINYFPCWDDALTVKPARLVELCAAIERDLRFPFRFGAITRANLVTRDLLRTMRHAGLDNVNFGVESGDDDILKAIKKGVRTDHVVRALEWAKEEGLITACNFMLGFPQETPVELERTLRFMERIAPMVDAFSTMGVVVPFPGTPIYEEFHSLHGFTDWWLRPAYSRYAPPPPLGDFERYYRYYIDDANLELDFFHYSGEMQRLIRECLRFKAEHNLERMGLMPSVGVR
jgi:anaerobic magnesium-protoporphyrin IX monomethyl ester cyclase